MFEVFKPPKSFGSSVVEDAFLADFHRTGVRLAKIAFVVASAMALAFWVLLELAPSATQVSFARQLVRLFLTAILLSAALVLHLLQATAINWYRLSVGVPMAIGCLVVGSLGLVPLDTGDLAINRFVVAMTLTCWLCYGFTRLPTPLVAVSCVPASLLTLLGVALRGDDHVLALGVYLAVANLIGWILSAEVERRERALFLSSRQLRQTTRDLEEMARKASEADEAKTRVLAAVSHDLRQPLASLTLYAQLLRETGPFTSASGRISMVDSLDACIGAISSDLDRLSELGLRDGGAPLPVKPIDLRPVLERIERVYSGQAIRCAVRLCVRLPKSGDCTVISNESRLWDVFANLVGNALKFSAPEREAWVLVRVRRRCDRVEVVVRDNGIGVEPCDQRRVFDEYFQVSNPERSPKRGQGLGLSIVRETIARLPGHSIALFSIPGRGTRFTAQLPTGHASTTRVASAGNRPSRIAETTRYRLPVDLPAEQLAERVSDSREARYRVPASKPYRGYREAPVQLPEAGVQGRVADAACVLIVEDDESMRDALGRMFERWGIEIALAASGEEAVRMTAESQQSFDAIVSDFRLPGAWDGLRLIEELRRLEGHRTPAILLSGEFRVEALRSDAPSDVHVMGKPPDVALLRELIIGYARGDDELARSARA